MKHNYLIGERIRLRAMEPEDIEHIYRLENDPHQWSVSNFNVPYSLYDVRRYLEQSHCDIFIDRQLRLIMTRQTDNEVVGLIDITDFSPMHSRGEVGVVVRSAYRREGYAGEALTLLCDYAFDYLGMNQLTAHIETTNEACLHTFHACGFHHAGVLRQWLFVEGEYRDVCFLQRIRGEE
jgi:diamine N-acetyltransferase